jgi:hypothetical protein
MGPTPSARVSLAIIAFVASGVALSRPVKVGSAHSAIQQSDADLLRDTERRRLRALVDADTAAAMPLHAPDFQLVTPSGSTMTREEYLGRLASKYLDYVVWEPDSISVRVYGTAAVLRYKSRLIMVVAGRDTIRPFAHWHTDLYEKHDGHWQVVWSQATAIR